MDMRIEAIQKRLFFLSVFFVTGTKLILTNRIIYGNFSSHNTGDSTNGN